MQEDVVDSTKPFMSFSFSFQLGFPTFFGFWNVGIDFYIV